VREGEGEGAPGTENEVILGHIVCAEHYCNMALSIGLLRAATREDILKFKCMHAEQMMHKCKEFSAKVSQSVHQL